MYGYNGQYPGPLIKGDRGSTVIINFTNEIEMPTTVHWHGLRLDNRFDFSVKVGLRDQQAGDQRGDILLHAPTPSKCRITNTVRMIRLAILIVKIWTSSVDSCGAC